MKAEIDQFGPIDRAGAQQTPAALGRPAPDEIEAHALQTQLEVDQVHRLDLAEDRLAPAVDRFVGEEWHERLRILRLRAPLGYIRSVRSMTRISSSTDVDPSTTRRA